MNQTTSKPPFYDGIRFGVLVIIVLPLAIASALWVSSIRTLNSKLSAIRDSGLPTSGMELNEFYEVPEGRKDTTELWLTAIHGVADVETAAEAKELPFLWQVETPKAETDWKELKAARAYIETLSEEFDTIHTAAAAGGVVRFPVDFSMGINTLLPDTQFARTVARLLVLDAHVNARDGKHGRAFRNVVAIFRLSDTLQAEPSLISQLVRMALHSMG